MKKKFLNTEEIKQIIKKKELQDIKIKLKETNNKLSNKKNLLNAFKNKSDIDMTIHLDKNINNFYLNINKENFKKINQKKRRSVFEEEMTLHKIDNQELQSLYSYKNYDTNNTFPKKKINYNLNTYDSIQNNIDNFYNNSQKKKNQKISKSIKSIKNVKNDNLKNYLTENSVIKNINMKQINKNKRKYRRENSGKILFKINNELLDNKFRKIYKTMQVPKINIIKCDSNEEEEEINNYFNKFDSFVKTNNKKEIIDKIKINLTKIKQNKLKFKNYLKNK